MTKRGRRALAAVWLASGVLCAVPLVTGGAPAHAASAFNATAIADGARVTVNNPGFPLTDTPVDVSFPSAQAVLSSSGTSQAFSGAPFPGFVATLPSTLAGLGASGVPEIPVYRASDYPAVESAQASQAGLLLKADSSETESRGEAIVGVSGVGFSVAEFKMNADVKLEDGNPVATATSSVAGLKLGAISVGTMTSTSKMSIDSEGKPDQETSFRIAAIDIGGLVVGLNEKGLTIAGTDIPLPGASDLLSSLSQEGTSFKFLPSVKTETLVSSAALEVQTRQTVPGVGVVNVTVVLGRSIVTIDGVIAGDEVTAPADLTDTPSDFVAPVGGDFPSLPPVPGVIDRATNGGGTGINPVPVAATIPRPFDVGGFYPLLVFAAASAFAALQAIRHFGMRVSWTS